MRVGEMLRERTDGGYPILCQAVSMGQDYTICVWGGDIPHVGSVVMSVARPSLTGEGTGVTSSVINGMGHKDEYVARKFAEAAAMKYNCTVVCTCGIHIDHITKEQLKDVADACDRLLMHLLENEKLQNFID